MSWLSRLLGVDEIVRQVEEVLIDLQAERAESRQILRDVLHTSETQAQTNAQMMQAISTIAQAYVIDGPPEGRHIDDVREAELWEQRQSYDS
jgi:fructose-bisphosphate aldolase class 1